MLKGKDINKWRILFKNTYLIHSFDGLNVETSYPSIYKFLFQFKDKLMKRSDQGKYWYNLRACAYDDLFEKEKIMYGEIVPEPRFIFDNGTFYMEATGFILNSNSINLKYLLGLLNSKLLFWYFKDIGYNLGGKGYRYKKIFIEQIPIKFTNKTTENKVINLVNELIILNNQVVAETNIFNDILIKKCCLKHISKNLEKYYELTESNFFKELKKQHGNIYDKEKLSSDFKTSSILVLELNDKITELEIELNKIIYDIYNLTDIEISIIENSF